MSAKATTARFVHAVRTARQATAPHDDETVSKDGIRIIMPMTDTDRLSTPADMAELLKRLSKTPVTNWRQAPLRIFA